MEVDPAGTEGKSHDLPWEISVSVEMMLTTLAVTIGEGHGEVSRGHSSQ